MAREGMTNISPAQHMHFPKAEKAVLVAVSDQERAGNEETILKAQCSGHNLIPIKGSQKGSLGWEI